MGSQLNLQPEAGQYLDHVAVDETVVRLDDEQRWLYVAVDAKTYELLHAELESRIKEVFAHSSLAEISEKHDVSDAMFLVDGPHSLQDAPWLRF